MVRKDARDLEPRRHSSGIIDWLVLVDRGGEEPPIVGRLGQTFERLRGLASRTVEHDCATKRALGRIQVAGRVLELAEAKPRAALGILAPNIEQMTRDLERLAEISESLRALAKALGARLRPRGPRRARLRRGGAPSRGFEALPVEA